MAALHITRIDQKRSLPHCILAQCIFSLKFSNSDSKKICTANILFTHEHLAKTDVTGQRYVWLAQMTQAISLMSYFCSRFCECRQCLSKWEVQTWYMAPCQNRWDFGLPLKLVSSRSDFYSLCGGPKSEGHPTMN